MVETAGKVNGFSCSKRKLEEENESNTPCSRLRMIVQIYEIQTPQEGRAMIDLNVDHVGSVLTGTKQWQQPLIKETIQTVQRAGRQSCLIPLFTDLELICKAIEYYRPDMIHFCETLPSTHPNGRCINAIITRQDTVRKRFGQLEIMRSIPIGESGHPDLVPSLVLAGWFESISDWFLTDTLLAPRQQSIDADQPVEGYVGITGVTCDWDIARQLVKQSAIPVILAGGIGPVNVSSAIAQTRPAGVDSCTQTNARSPSGQPIRFKKDVEKVRAMVEIAKNYGKINHHHELNG